MPKHTHTHPLPDPRRPAGSPPRTSAGIALVTVLLVVAAATIAAVSISARLQVDIRRTENLLRTDQAWLHMLGAESWAKGVLAEDLRNSPGIDAWDEDWSEPIQNDVEGGMVEGRITDRQGLFDLNRLLMPPDEEAARVPGGRTLPSVVSGEDVDRFKRLLINLELDELPVDELVDALLDWLDEDGIPRDLGAEDDFYQSLEPPYSTANRPMAHPSELLLVKGFTPEIYEKLAGFVTALPERVTLNVNTAKPEVLQSWFKGFQYKDAETLVDEMKTAPYHDIGDFMTEGLARFSLTTTSRDGLGVDSRYFSLHSRVTVGRSRVAMVSLLHRLPTGDVEVLQRMREDMFQ